MLFPAKLVASTEILVLQCGKLCTLAHEVDALLLSYIKQTLVT